MPRYTTYRSGLGHLPVFTGIVELAGITFTGEPAKNKKQAEKNAAMSAWSSLKQLAKQDASSSSEPENNDEQEQIRIARALMNYKSKQKIGKVNYVDHHPIPFEKKFTTPSPRPPSPQRQPLTTSKILPLLYQKHDPSLSSSSSSSSHQNRPTCPPFPVRYYRAPRCGMAPPVTMRTAVPVFSAPPVTMRTAVPVFSAPPVRQVVQQVVQVQARPVKVAPPICVRQAVPVFSAPPVKKEDDLKMNESEAVKCLQNLKL